MKRYDDPMRAVDDAKRGLKHRGFGERHIVMSNGKYRIVNPNVDPAHYGLIVARLFHPSRT